MARIQAISYYLPERILSNTELSEVFPDWSSDKIYEKTGIEERRIAAEDEYTSTMAVSASSKLFSEYNIQPSEVDFILLCTQSPDYFLPTTACLVQEALNIPTTAGALDFNLGCSGYVYGLSLAKGLILSEELNNVLLITSESYSKYIYPGDKSVRTIFGDAAAATLVSRTGAGGVIGKFAYGTDGRGEENLIVKSGAGRHPVSADNLNKDDYLKVNSGAILQTDSFLYMSGPDIFTFTLKVIPDLIDRLLLKNKMKLEDVDFWVFHQANRYMLEHLRKKLKIDEDKFYISMAFCGNTVSSTIPIALKNALSENKIKPGMKVLIAGFGVGYSWGGTIIEF